MQCPKCHNNLVKIFYGLPTVDVIKKAQNKEIYIGGCEITDYMPTYHCYNCHINYFKDLKHYEIADLISNSIVSDYLVNDQSYIFSYKLSDAWGFLIYEIKIYNRKQDNIIVSTTKKYKYFTISQNLINKIINIILDTDLYNIDKISFPPVLDGNQNEFTVNIDDHFHKIIAYNLWYWEENPYNDSSIDRLLKCFHAIKTILKENNIDLKIYDDTLLH